MMFFGKCVGVRIEFMSSRPCFEKVFTRVSLVGNQPSDSPEFCRHFVGVGALPLLIG
jgi:hypothetical protein